MGLLEVLKQSGAEITHVSVVNDSLEDVFVQMTASTKQEVAQ